MALYVASASLDNTVRRIGGLGAAVRLRYARSATPPGRSSCASRQSSVTIWPAKATPHPGAPAKALVYPQDGGIGSGRLPIRETPTGDPTMKQATIHTDFGDMTIRFFPEIAPKHVENFIDLAEQGFYDNRTFHRIVEGFMIQGGCPRGDGTGHGPRRLKAEFSNKPHKLGTLSMARTSDPNSASCQFFICLDRCDFLDGKYTVFGELVDEASVETLKKIEKVKVYDPGTGEKSAPVEEVRICSITVQEVPDA